ncbi:hypothetical protein K492DRAFT_197833 [Lichtheimia hyalospora FSU 10163]|nr:hypothetical protein K492DRAFT_197833 [Lichtheimia hyalospora FSU 10163]
MENSPGQQQQPKQQHSTPFHNNDNDHPPPSYAEVAAAASSRDRIMGDNRSSTPQSHYRTIVIEQANIAPILSPIDIERQFPVAALFFIFGWLCPPLWIVGACCCMGSQHRYESFWGNACLVMALIASLTSIIYSSVVIANKNASG